MAVLSEAHAHGNVKQRRDFFLRERLRDTKRTVDRLVHAVQQHCAQNPRNLILALAQINRPQPQANTSPLLVTHEDGAIEQLSWIALDMEQTSWQPHRRPA